MLCFTLLWLYLGHKINNICLSISYLHILSLLSFINILFLLMLSIYINSIFLLVTSSVYNLDFIASFVRREHYFLDL